MFLFFFYNEDTIKIETGNTIYTFVLWTDTWYEALYCANKLSPKAITMQNQLITLAVSAFSLSANATFLWNPLVSPANICFSDSVSSWTLWRGFTEPLAMSELRPFWVLTKLLQVIRKMSLSWNITATVDLYGSGLGQATYLYCYFMF